MKDGSAMIRAVQPTFDGPLRHSRQISGVADHHNFQYNLIALLGGIP
jgi:hypothetical protein